MTPEVEATLILKGIAQGQGILVFPAKQLWDWRVNRWFPRLFESALQAAAHRADTAGQQEAVSDREAMLPDTSRRKTR